MAPPKDIARSYPKRGLTADVGFRSEPKFCGDGSAEFSTGIDGTGTYTNTLGDTLSMCCWVWNNAVSNAYFMDLGTNSSKAQISISYHNGTGAGINSRPYIWNGSSVIIATEEMAAKEWHHLAVTAAPGSGNIKIYLDGVDVTPSHSTDVNITTNAILLGKWVGAASGNFNGKMANAALFRTTLTQEQVRECMRASSFSQFDAISTLEAFYPLDANFNDSTSGGHNLTVTGSPSFTVDRPQLPRGLDLARGAAQARCFTGRAVDLDGSTDFLDMGLGVDKNYTTRSDRASFSVWFNADQTASVAFLYQNRHNNIGGTDRPECETQLFSSSTHLFFDGEGASVSVPIANVTIGKWHHFVGIADDSDGPVKVYLDGVLYDTTGLAQAGANGNNFVIGARNNSPLQPFNGKLSNFKIFNVELTQAQVRELYHNPEMVIPTGVSASNLRRHYPLCAYNDTGGMGGRYEIDQGVEGVNGEYGGSPVMDFGQPVPCPQLGLQQSATRLYFTGTTSNKVTASTTTVLGTSFAVGLWIQRENADGVFVQSESGTNQLYYQSGNIVYFSATHSQNVSVSNALTPGVWHHILVTSSGLYLNGSSIDSLSGTPGWSGSTTTFGCIPSNGLLPFKGIMANAVYWDGDLAAAEVLELYNQGVGYDPRNDTGNYTSSSDVVHYWKFDDLTTVVDRVGSANGTVSGTLHAASFPENASESTIVGDFSMKRKGVSVLNIPASTTNEQAIIPANQDVYPSFANGGSLSLFFRLEKLGTTSTIFINSGYGTTHERFAVYAVSTNKIQFELGDGASARANPQTTGTISDSDWHHFAMTVDYGGGSTTTIKLFIDGVLDSTSTATTLAGVPNASALEILNRGSGNEGKGPLACFKAYQVTLSDNEIKQIYNSDLRLIKGLENE